MASFKMIGLKELRSAVKRNPQKVKQESARFIDRGLRLYRNTIMGRPWTVNSQGGGAPKDTGDLGSSHRIRKSTFKGSIGPSRGGKPIDYASYVHDGTRHLDARPWLDFAREKNDAKIKQLTKKLLKNITRDLAK